MPMGATVSRIRTELIFLQCWNLITLGCEIGRSSWRPISLAGLPFRGIEPARYLAKAEAVLIHFCDRPFARMTFSSDQRPIVGARPFVGPGSKPDGLCAFRQLVRLHLIDVINWRSHSLLLTFVGSLKTSRGQIGSTGRQKLAHSKANKTATTGARLGADLDTDNGAGPGA
jgi:hypothetical protein